MNFIGIDLSWSVKFPKHQRTAAVVLSEDYQIIESNLITTDYEILEFIKPYIDGWCIVGIDAPLVIPPFVKQRECERFLLLGKIAAFPGNRDWFDRAFGGTRGEILAKNLKRMGIPLKDRLIPKENTNALLEVYPHALWKVLFNDRKVPRYKNAKMETKRNGLLRLKKALINTEKPAKIKLSGDLKGRLDAIKNLRGEDLDKVGDLLDATIAAYTLAVYWHYGDLECVIFGDLKNGFILTLANERLKDLAKKRKS